MLVRAVLVVCLFFRAISLAAADDSDISRVRGLGAAMAHARTRGEAGTPPTAEELGRFNLALEGFAPLADGNQPITTKLHALRSELSLLQHIAEKPTLYERRAPLRSQYVSEVVTPGHGAACSNALGLPPDRPLRLSLQPGAQAWLYVPARALAALRVMTNSDGPDPALDVFETCASQDSPLASNDDALGLDSEVTVVTSDRTVIYVRLLNRGESGPIDVSSVESVGTISGTVRDAHTGQALLNAYVEAFASTSQGAQFAATYTATDGTYTLAPGVAGTYYVAADANLEIAEVYPSGSCEYSSYSYLDFTTCDVSHATAVTVSATNSPTRIDFSLSPGVRISGQVRTSSNDPLQSASVLLIGSTGHNLALTATDAAGNYNFANLPPDTYFMQSGQTGYVTQLWNHINCFAPSYQPCSTAQAVPIIVGTSDVADINFALQRVSLFTGTLSDSNGPIGTAYFASYVYAMDPSGTIVADGNGDATGHYTISPVAPGTYYLYASVGGYFDQLYAGHDCAQPCPDELASGLPLQITANEQQIEADFVLNPFPSMSGRITDAGTGAPLSNAQVVVTTTPNTPYYPATVVNTDPAGNYLVYRIAPGEYYVWAQSPDHVDEIFDGVACEDPDYYYPNLHCDLSAATLLTVSHDGASPQVMNFGLRRSGSITGHAIARAGAGSDLPAMDIAINLYDSSGTSIASTSVDASGQYVIPDLAPGTYYIVASGPYPDPRYISQMWQNKDCTTCVPTTATPIQVALGAAVAGIDFQITRLDAVVGRVVDQSGQPIRGAVVDLFNTTDKSYAFGAAVDEQGFYVVPGNLGSSYYVATEAGGAYVDQVYSGIVCSQGNAYDGRCSLAGALGVNLSSSATQPHVVNFVLKSTDPIFADGFE